MANNEPVKREKYHVWDSTNRSLPANPPVKFVRNFDELIDKLEVATDTIFDLLWLYNISGMMIEKVVKYRDPDEDFGIRVAYTIFGTYVKENDTDRYFPEAETGPYNLGNTSDWSDRMDLSMWVEQERLMHDLPTDIKTFYNTSSLNISATDPMKATLSTLSKQLGMNFNKMDPAEVQFFTTLVEKYSTTYRSMLPRKGRGKK